MRKELLLEILSKSNSHHNYDNSDYTTGWIYSDDYFDVEDNQILSGIKTSNSGNVKQIRRYTNIDSKECERKEFDYSKRYSYFLERKLKKTPSEKDIVLLGTRYKCLLMYDKLVLPHDLTFNHLYERDLFIAHKISIGYCITDKEKINKSETFEVNQFIMSCMDILANMILTICWEESTERDRAKILQSQFIEFRKFINTRLK